MHIHNVYFWLKDDEDAASKAEFVEGLGWLVDDPNVESGFAGPPIASERDVVDSSYSFGLVLVFADRAAHDRYQVGEPHDRFLAANKMKWDKLIVYDLEG